MQETIQIINSTSQDISTIFEFYDMAIAHQKQVSNMHWKGFDLDLVKKEIEENRQYKILVNGKVAAIFLVTFSDHQIWQERDKEPSIYIHRIVTNPEFRGYGFVSIIINWAKEYALQNHLQYIRIDTWAENKKLLAYYTNCGFAHVKTTTTQPNSGLPKHYEGINLNLFEIRVNN
jgi:ribosomal protein S18 acetylase RimI-like enzyme